MFLMLAVHVYFGITLTLENSAANPSKYAVRRKLKATFASETMIWTGVLLLAFLVYHLLQFTFRITRTSCRRRSPTARATSTGW